MDATVEFLWQRRTGGLAPGTVQAWAIHLLESGADSEAIRRLAAQPEERWQDVQPLISQALLDIGAESLEIEQNLLRAYEQESVADYLSGRIDGWTLIGRGCRLSYDTDDLYYDFWIDLGDEAGQHGQGLCFQYPFDRGDFDDVLKQVLRESGRFSI